MCGIVGVITKDDDTHKYTKEKFMTEALYVDALRGWDSTGVMGLSEDFRWEYLKNAKPAADFLQSKEWRGRQFDRWCMVGHNRAATVGKVTTDNAHPFQQGDILLVHNGTLRGHFDLEHKNSKIDVDSELIAYNLSQVPPEGAVDVLSRLNGAYALVWFDERDKSVNMARNSERPLHVSMNRGQDLLYFMSDGHMLSMITRRTQNQAALPNGIWQIATNQLLKYKKGNLVPEVTAVPNFTRTVVTHRDWGTSMRNSEDTGTRTKWKTTRTPRSNDGVLGGRGDRWNKLLIGGTYREIPEAFLDMTENWYSFVSGVGLYFKPKGWMYWGKKTPEVSGHESKQGAMYGEIFHPEWNCFLKARIPWVNQRQAEQYKNNKGWTVVPIGIDHTSVDGDRDELTIICRMVWYSWHETPPVVKRKISDDKADDFILEEEDDFEDMVKGPHGHYISVDAFIKLTEDGCTMCTGPVFIEDAEELEWVGQMGNQPLCMGCLDYHTQADPTGTYFPANEV